MFQGIKTDKLKTLLISILEHRKVKSMVVNLKKMKSGNTLECTVSIYRNPNKLEAHANKLTIYNTFIVQCSTESGRLFHFCISRRVSFPTPYLIVCNCLKGRDQNVWHVSLRGILCIKKPQTKLFQLLNRELTRSLAPTLALKI